MNNDRMSSRLLALSLVIFLLTGCTSFASTNLASSGASKFAKSTISKPTQPSIQSQSSTPTPSTIQSPTVTPTPHTSQSPSKIHKPPATQPPSVSSTAVANIKTVFVIVMENHNWSDILGSTSAPYINQTLLPQASYTQQYFNPPGTHPSEPNYLWLEAGTSFGISNDDAPQSNHQGTTDHLVSYLQQAGITWKAYVEGITGKVCPLTGKGLYAPKHNPMVYFDDVTGNNNPNATYCIQHERPYNELQSDLQSNTVAQYNFITPNLCDDMHNTDGCQTSDAIKNGDTWLSKQIPMIMDSKAYKQGGVIFITWDEAEGGDHPIGMIVLSPYVKGGGYSNSIHYTHSSTLRTIQEIFNITPLLGDASKATDLSDLFTKFP